jgi:hypothetical protein
VLELVDSANLSFVDNNRVGSSPSSDKIISIKYQIIKKKRQNLNVKHQDLYLTNKYKFSLDAQFRALIHYYKNIKHFYILIQLI